MYVFYPASRLVGLTINYSEINQACLFPALNSKAELEHETQFDKNHFEETSANDQSLIQTSDNQDSKRDCFPRQSVSPCPKTVKSQSESPDIPPNKPPRKKKSGKNQREIEKSPETISLEENLKNLEVYRATKPTSVKRSWSLHFKKAVTPDFINMAGSDYTLKDMTHPALNDTLKSHNAVTFKLIKTVGEFTEALGHTCEQYAEEMQLLVSNFRKKNSELRKERPACASSLFHTWETLLQEVEIDAQAQAEIASILGRQISRPLTEKTFFRKIQARKVFSHRDAYESLIKLTEEKLAKTRIEYKTTYLAYMNNPSSQALANYIASHNEYVSQLHVTNGVLNQYHSEILPGLLQEIEDIYNDLCVKISDSILQVAETTSSKALEQGKRYEQLTAQCRSVQGPTDLAHLVRSVTTPVGHPPTRRQFTAPQPPSAQIGPDGQQLPVDSTTTANQPPVLKNEIVLDRTTSAQIKEKYESAKKEFQDLETQVKQLSDALHTLTRVQQRSIDSNLFNNVNELQEDISAKQHELNMTLMRLSGVRAQKELFSNKLESAETVRERKMSSSSTGSMKSKWMKAFKSLKAPPTNGTAAKEGEKKNQMYHAVSTILAMRKNGKEGASSFVQDPSAHAFQDYTYKKITPCDVCSQVLRGHARQGLKCKVCKINVHVDCQDKAAKCQQKSRLLRRQKSTSEIDTKVHEPPHEEEPQKSSTSIAKQVHYEKEQNPLTGGRLSPSNAVGRVSQPNLALKMRSDSLEFDRPYHVLKHPSDISSKPLNVGRSHFPHESYQNPNMSPPATVAAAAAASAKARSEFYLEKTGSVERNVTFERKSEHHYPSPKYQKGYSRSEYQMNPEFYQSSTEYYQHSPPRAYKNRLSDPGVLNINPGACMGPSSGGTATSGPSFLESGLQSRRQQGPMLLRGSTSHSIGPVPVASSSDDIDTALRRRLFSGFKSFSVFGGKSRGALPSSRSISLPETPHSPRRQKLNLRMKSLSLDSPESTEHAQKRRAQASYSAGHSTQSSSSKIHSPSSPVHGRRLLTARNMRMSSVELPDDNEKSLSSASTSPCPSPKPHRLLPTNLYVVLYNFKSRQPDELDLKAGYKVTVMDTSDPDWWKGKCLGRVGYFPSKYVIKLEPGERPLQVTHNLQVQDGDMGLMLLRDQIVIQVGEDVDGMVMIRNADNKQGACPVKYLQEV